MNPVDSIESSDVDTSPLLDSKEEEGMSTGSNAAAFVDSLRLIPEVTGIHPDDEDHAEAQVPTWTQCLQNIKAKYSLYHVPIKILVANVISFMMSQSLIRSSGDVGRYIQHGNGVFSRDAYYSQFKSMVATGLTICILTHLANSYLFFQGTRRLYRYMLENEECEYDGDTTAIASGRDNEDDRNQPELRVYSRLSRRVDSTLGMARSAGTTTPNQTFLVCFLYALCSLAIWKSAVDTTSLVQIHLLTAADVPVKGKCCVGGDSFYDFSDDFGDSRNIDRSISSLRKESDFETKVPKDVQDWIRSHRGSWEGTYVTPVFNRSHTYFHTANGDLVFLNPSTPRSVGSNQRGSKRDKAGVVVYTPETRDTQTFVANATNSEDSFDDGVIDLVAFPSKAPYTGWCAIFRSQGYNILQDEVLCYNDKILDGGTLSPFQEKMKRFDAVRDIKGEWGGSSYGPNNYSLYATNDTLWIVRFNEFSYQKSEMEQVYISLVSYDISKMEKTVALTREVEYSRSNHHSRSRAARLADSSDCDGYATAIWVVSGVSLSLLMGLLYRSEIASSPVPGCFAVWVILDSVLRNQDATASILLACGCACLFLLVYVPRSNRNTKNNIWRYVSTDMAIWALYTFQFLSQWLFWSSTVTIDWYFDLEDILSSISFPLCSFLVAAATTVLLNHPFFQIQAVCFAGFSIFSLFFYGSSFFGFHGSHMLMVSVILFAGSFGCFRMGTLLQVYRVHIIVFIRRVGRAWIGKCCKGRQTFSEPRNWLPLVLLAGAILFICNRFYRTEAEYSDDE